MADCFSCSSFAACVDRLGLRQLASVRDTFFEAQAVLSLPAAALPSNLAPPGPPPDASLRRQPFPGVRVGISHPSAETQFRRAIGKRWQLPRCLFVQGKAWRRAGWKRASSAIPAGLCYNGRCRQYGRQRANPAHARRLEDASVFMLTFPLRRVMTIMRSAWPMIVGAATERANPATRGWFRGHRQSSAQAAAIIVAVHLCGSSLWGQNLLHNHSFEKIGSGVPEGWTRIFNPQLSGPLTMFPMPKMAAAPSALRQRSGTTSVHNTWPSG